MISRIISVLTRPYHWWKSSESTADRKFRFFASAYFFSTSRRACVVSLYTFSVFFTEKLVALATPSCKTTIKFILAIQTIGMSIALTTFVVACPVVAFEAVQLATRTAFFITTICAVVIAIAYVRVGNAFSVATRKLAVETHWTICQPMSEVTNWMTWDRVNKCGVPINVQVSEFLIERLNYRFWALGT